ncbi:MAG: DUF1761 domain-containing protein [Chitinophagales bacterium]|nr:DUF1761 domain-containing protein [Chitinophagales bacterium]
MVKINFLVTALAALIPLVTGSIWYNPKVMGNAWIKTTGLAEEKLREANMAVVFGMTLVFSFMLSLIMNVVVIHQFGFQSMLMEEVDLFTPGSEANTFFTTTMEKYGHTFHTFRHGAFHGIIMAIFFVTPVIGILALFERKGAKYILIHMGYWLLTLALMGGVICRFS